MVGQSRPRRRFRLPKIPEEEEEIIGQDTQSPDEGEQRGPQPSNGSPENQLIVELRVTRNNIQAKNEEYTSTSTDKVQEITEDPVYENIENIRLRQRKQKICGEKLGNIIECATNIDSNELTKEFSKDFVASEVSKPVICDGDDCKSDCVNYKLSNLVNVINQNPISSFINNGKCIKDNEESASKSLTEYKNFPDVNNNKCRNELKTEYNYNVSTEENNKANSEVNNNETPEQSENATETENPKLNERTIINSNGNRSVISNNSENNPSLTTTFMKSVRKLRQGSSKSRKPKDRDDVKGNRSDDITRGAHVATNTRRMKMTSERSVSCETLIIEPSLQDWDEWEARDPSTMPSMVSRRKILQRRTLAPKQTDYEDNENGGVSHCAGEEKHCQPEEIYATMDVNFATEAHDVNDQKGNKMINKCNGNESDYIPKNKVIFSSPNRPNNKERLKLSHKTTDKKDSSGVVRKQNLEEQNSKGIFKHISASGSPDQSSTKCELSASEIEEEGYGNVTGQEDAALDAISRNKDDSLYAYEGRQHLCHLQAPKEGQADTLDTDSCGYQDEREKGSPDFGGETKEVLCSFQGNHTNIGCPQDGSFDDRSASEYEKIVGSCGFPISSNGDGGKTTVSDNHEAETENGLHPDQKCENSYDSHEYETVTLKNEHAEGTLKKNKFESLSNVDTLLKNKNNRATTPNDIVQGNDSDDDISSGNCNPETNDEPLYDVIENVLRPNIEETSDGCVNLPPKNETSAKNFNERSPKSEQELMRTEEASVSNADVSVSTDGIETSLRTDGMETKTRNAEDSMDIAENDIKNPHECDEPIYQDPDECKREITEHPATLGIMIEGSAVNGYKEALQNDDLIIIDKERLEEKLEPDDDVAELGDHGTQVTEKLDKLVNNEEHVADKLVRPTNKITIVSEGASQPRSMSSDNVGKFRSHFESSTVSAPGTLRGNCSRPSQTSLINPSVEICTSDATCQTIPRRQLNKTTAPKSWLKSLQMNDLAPQVENRLPCHVLRITAEIAEYQKRSEDIKRMATRATGYIENDNEDYDYIRTNRGEFGTPTHMSTLCKGDSEPNAAKNLSNSLTKTSQSTEDLKCNTKMASNIAVSKKEFMSELSATLLKQSSVSENWPHSDNVGPSSYLAHSKILEKLKQFKQGSHDAPRKSQHIESVTTSAGKTVHLRKPVLAKGFNVQKALQDKPRDFHVRQHRPQNKFFNSEMRIRSKSESYSSSASKTHAREGGGDVESVSSDTSDDSGVCNDSSVSSSKPCKVPKNLVTKRAQNIKAGESDGFLSTVPDFQMKSNVEDFDDNSVKWIDPEVLAKIRSVGTTVIFFGKRQPVAQNASPKSDSRHRRSDGRHDLWQVRENRKNFGSDSSKSQKSIKNYDGNWVGDDSDRKHDKRELSSDVTDYHSGTVSKVSQQDLTCNKNMRTSIKLLEKPGNENLTHDSLQSGKLIGMNHNEEPIYSNLLNSKRNGSEPATLGSEDVRKQLALALKSELRKCNNLDDEHDDRIQMNYPLKSRDYSRSASRSDLIKSERQKETDEAVYQNGNRSDINNGLQKCRDHRESAKILGSEDHAGLVISSDTWKGRTDASSNVMRIRVRQEREIEEREAVMQLASETDTESGSSTASTPRVVGVVRKDQ
ncbi:probable GPI-anchored adhesin-like protein PGA55 [Hyalella azteca]|uniref:Probable GPI-anchored adhesin-like protein PGA55 n=1 Tax=Hyalella azteca TaxID=294128 RepID=A0A8B7P1N3_HYAAZ|nr:probable GPI-anchored adhesin-like protein PGA55 [Hyalella azteca]